MIRAGVIRRAIPADGAACADIYAPYVRDTAITFETDPPDAAAMSDRIAASLARWDWLVATGDSGDVVGYAYGTEHKSRAAYRWACEVSVYLDRGHVGHGLGRALYRELFAALASRGFVVAVAGMTLPNDASAGLHRSMGFEPIGTWAGIGFKHGAWRDVAWMQCDLIDRRGLTLPPTEPS